MTELRRSFASAMLVAAYRWRVVRSLCVRLALRLEGGEFYSATLRTILERHHKVRVGAYSYGECVIPGAFPAGVQIGRYVSMAPGVRVFLRNHPLERLSMHPFFYNHQLGWLAEDTVTAGTLVIEHDAWIGERAILTPGCSRIGLGAVVGAGAVVTRDVPDFAVVAGNPAKILRYRFPAEVQDLIRNSKWWEQPIEACVKAMPFMTQALTGEALYRHPLLSQTRGTKAQVEDAAGVSASR
jgi:virginiamycin A acetyltransferase